MNQAVNIVVMSTRLLCQIGGADKEYVVKVVRCGEDTYHVKGYNGRRGSALKEQPKTKTPVALDVATKEYNKIIKSKLSGQYQIVDDVSGEYQQIDNPLQLVSGHSPALPSAITREEALRLINNPLWCAQEKIDGERAQAATELTSVIGTNRKAVEVPLPVGVVNTLLSLRGDTGNIHVDGERIGDRLFVFDLLAYGEQGNIKHWPFEKRAEHLKDLCVDAGSDIVFVPVAYTAEQKQALFDRVDAANGEGLVFKRVDGKYIEGKVASDSNILKFKFYEEATLKVTSKHPTKQSVGISVLGADGEDHPVGNVTIPANADMPKVGDFINVRYLYWFENGSLYQPIYSRARPDKDMADGINSLKVKPVIAQ